ncbi:MAG: YqeG family HAD IIIA-type phosphatase [Clostridiales bacterium]|jgi:HAD superfamily phosphatase (TIGR01668 family)|nr:YqeG family HAD IIIA-type phosphatase [Clostridiales bacterium]MDR2751451.1 YqeG family HAD IIIA-type phosphatase [Clostridiales bacterium]
MFKNLFPDHYYDSVFEIPYKDLKSEGIKAIIFDIDNTLAEYRFAMPPERTINLIKRLQKMGLKVCLLTNNNKRSLDRFNKGLKLPAYSQGLKPLAGKAKRAMKEMGATPAETMIIGDQVLTDIWCAKKIKAKAILVKPMSDRDIWTVKLKRGLEKVILSQYEKSLKAAAVE